MAAWRKGPAYSNFLLIKGPLPMRLARPRSLMALVLPPLGWYFPSQFHPGMAGPAWKSIPFSSATVNLALSVSEKKLSSDRFGGNLEPGSPMAAAAGPLS